MMSLIKPLVAAFERRLAGAPGVFFWYSLPYRGVVRRELVLSGIKRSDRVLVIGCGAIPFTAVLTARMSGASVVAVDCDMQAVLRARILVERLGLDRQITVIHANAATDRLPAARVALVALQAGPKEAIRLNLRGCIDERDGCVLFRLARRKLEHQYGTLHVPSEHGSQVRHRMPTFDRSVLLPTEPALG